MKTHEFTILGAKLAALGTGALWWADQKTLTVSDLHLGKSERIARLGGPLLPPFEVQETLSRLEQDIADTGAKTVICLGDSFDDTEASRRLDTETLDRLIRLQAGRKWIWIEGNHDPGPLGLPGEHLAESSLGPLTFRHIADADPRGEISGHYHPKISIRGQSRRCFLYDETRVILPAYGTYTGGLKATTPALNDLFKAPAFAVMTGKTARVLPYKT